MGNTTNVRPLELRHLAKSGTALRRAFMARPSPKTFLEDKFALNDFGVANTTTVTNHVSTPQA
jgi:hypothetical protein